MLDYRIGSSTMEFKKLIISSIFLIVLITTQFSKITSQEVEDEKEFSYEEGDVHSPEKWGLIHKEWEMCNNGHNQSPIDLSDKKVEVYHELGRMKTTYRPSVATMVNRGHDIMLNWEGRAGGFWINGTEYILKQLHWHSPSEHTLNNKRFALELHMVHQSTNKDIAVVGIMYKFGQRDSFLSQMEKYISVVHNKVNNKMLIGLVDPRQIKRDTKNYYRYLGSLTTPPCTEGVIWTIINEERTVSRKQVELLREAVMDGMEQNARPQQKTYDRTVKHYRSTRRSIGN